MDPCPVEDSPRSKREALPLAATSGSFDLGQVLPHSGRLPARSPRRSLSDPCRHKVVPMALAHSPTGSDAGVGPGPSTGRWLAEGGSPARSRSRVTPLADATGREDRHGGTRFARSLPKSGHVIRSGCAARRRAMGLDGPAGQMVIAKRILPVCQSARKSGCPAVAIPWAGLLSLLDRQVPRPGERRRGPNSRARLPFGST